MDGPVSVPPSRSGLGGGAALAVLAVGLEKLVALGIALYLPRHLGLADYGHYVLLVSYLGFFQALPDAALEIALVTRLARAPEDRRPVAGAGAAVRLVVSLLGGMLGLGVLARVTLDPGLVTAAGVGAVGLATAAANPYRPLLRARLHMRAYLGLLAGQSALGVGLLVAVVRADGGLVAVFAALAAAAGGALGLGRMLAGPGARLRADPRLVQALVRDAWPLVGTTATLVGAQQVLQLVLLRERGPEEVALLGASQRLVDAALLLPQALMVSVLPALSLVAATPGRATTDARDAARLLIVLLVPVSLVLAFFAEPILSRAFGAPLVPAAPVLQLLAPLVLLGATGTVVSSLLLALGLQRVVLGTTAVAALLLVGVARYCVREAGAAGAAGALVGTMIVGQAALLCVPGTRREVGRVLMGVGRPLLLGGAVGLALAATPPLVGLAAVVVGYPVLLLVTGTVTSRDLARWR